MANQALIGLGHLNQAIIGSDHQTQVVIRSVSKRSVQRQRDNLWLINNWQKEVRF